MNELRDATHIGSELGSELGVNLLTFSGPERMGRIFLDVESYQWERREEGQVVVRATYQPEQATLCLQSLSGPTWLDKGCVSTRGYSTL
jgi:hypothetical protein